MAGDDGHRREVLKFLISKGGNAAWQETRLEREFHAELSQRASPELRELLATISLYETFSRRLHDAFEDCLHLMSRTRQRTTLSEMAKLKCVVRAAEEVARLYVPVRDRLSAFVASPRFEEGFTTFAEPALASEFAERLVSHHCRVQARKPPDGKSSWLEQFDDGSCVIRPAYMREEGGRNDNTYLHAYRTNSLWSFANDLRQL